MDIVLGGQTKIVQLSLEQTGEIRLARKEDIKDTLELWANCANLRQISDSVRWDWKNRASQIWLDYMLDLLGNPRKFLVIADFQDNGLTGFLTARLEELPDYYQACYSLTIEEFYLRPKERSPKLFREMIEFLLQVIRQNQALSDEQKISVKIEVLESEKELIALLFDRGQARKSSLTYSIDL